ncbi:MAG: NYN domain-containing protein [Nocardioides sp.]
MPDTSVRLAVLIDADNTPSSRARDLLEEIARYGTPTVKRAYGDWTGPQLGGWKVALNHNAIQPVQQFAYTTGKNATDSALIIDAMDLLYAGNLDAFAIVSSDSDFTRLATRLRESGKTVYGLGQRKTPESFEKACDKFIYLEVIGREAQEDTPAQEQDPSLPNLRKMLTRAINATSHDDGWTNLSLVGSYLNNSNASFDARNYGFGKLSALIRAQEYVEVGSDKQTPLRLRLREAATKAAKKAPARKRAAKKSTEQA